jgi:Leucine-rich repeat (LRR) protein
MSIPAPTLNILKKRINGNIMDLSSLRLKKIPFDLIWQCLGTDRDRELQITTIDLSNNLLTSFPVAKFCVIFPGVEKLDLRRNRLTNLPDNFGCLTALKELNLAHNQIKVLFNLFKNELKLNFHQTLPKSFGELEDLEWLNLSHNPLDQDLVSI